MNEQAVIRTQGLTRYYGARAAGARAILVPTAERDATIGLAVFAPVFRGVRAVMYNSPEERAMINAVSGNAGVPGTVVGVGSEIVDRPQPDRFRRKFGVTGRFALYVGRIDENKGCGELFDYFERYARTFPRGLDPGDPMGYAYDDGNMDPADASAMSRASAAADAAGRAGARFLARKASIRE